MWGTPRSRGGFVGANITRPPIVVVVRSVTSPQTQSVLITAFDHSQKMAGGEMARGHLAVGHGLSTDRLGERAARSQAAAGRNIDRARDLTGERERIALGLRIGLRPRAAPGPGERIGPPVEHTS